MTLLKTLLLSLLISLPFFNSACAEHPRYYITSVEVGSKADNEKAKASLTAFKNLVTKLTGEDLLEQEQPKNLTPYIDEFYYQDKDGALTVTFAFNKQQVKQFIEAKGKSLWSESPPLLLWSFSEAQEGYQWVTPQTNAELSALFEKEATRRSLSLISPEPDLNLLESLSGFKPQALLEKKLKGLSLSFTLPMFVSCYINELPDGSFKLELIVHIKDENHTILVSGTDYQDLIKVAFNKLVPEIKPELLPINKTSQTFVIEVQNIHNPKSYNDVQNTLQAVDSVTNLFLENLTEDSVTYKLDSSLSLRTLSSRLQQNKKLELEDASGNLLIFKLKS